jgi:hypothetical protein
MSLSGTELNCTAQEGPISADADIIGPGVSQPIFLKLGDREGLFAMDLQI